MTDAAVLRFWGHDGDWCRDCQEGCGEVYGGSCHCCIMAYGGGELDDEICRCMGICTCGDTRA